MQYSEYLSASEKKDELDRLSSENISGENISVIETDEAGEEEDIFFDARVDMVEQAIDEDQTEVVEEGVEQATDNNETESHGMTSTAVQYQSPGRTVWNRKEGNRGLPSPSRCAVSLPLQPDQVKTCANILANASADGSSEVNHYSSTMAKELQLRLNELNFDQSMNEG
jgi:hypothetical protein